MNFRTFKLDLGDCRFPLGTNLVDSLWVYTWGKVRPRLKAKESEIAAVGAPMPAVPQVSEFWYVDGTNGSKILTSSEHSVVPTSLQLELFPSGDYIARSNLVARQVCHKMPRRAGIWYNSRKIEGAIWKRN